MEQATLATEFFFGRKAPIFALQKPVKLAVLFTQILPQACACYRVLLCRKAPIFASQKTVKLANSITYSNIR